MSDGLCLKFLVKRVVQVVAWALELHNFQCRCVGNDLVSLVMSDRVDPA